MGRRGLMMGKGRNRNADECTRMEEARRNLGESGIVVPLLCSRLAVGSWQLALRYRYVDDTQMEYAAVPDLMTVASG